MNDTDMGMGDVFLILVGIVVVFFLGALLGARAEALTGDKAHTRACAVVYARALTPADSLALARQSGCPFQIEVQR